jgi:polysaccharide export outer membrane protein
MKKSSQAMILVVALLWGTAVVAKAPSQDGSHDADKKPAATKAPVASDPTKTPVKPKTDAAPVPLGYIIGEQDVLDINVWREKEITTTVVVRPDGKITLPLVNEIYVVGMTPMQLQQTLTEKLQAFLTVPQVTVIVREISSRKVYLIGQVGHGGPFHINSTTTVFQIIAEAGGLRDFAKRKKIYVLRNENGKETKLPFNYNAVLKGDSTKDFVLHPGDTIVVP